MSVTELNLSPGRRVIDWTLNVAETDASAGIELKPATPDYCYGIKRMVISIDASNRWIKLLDGDDLFIGPVVLSKNVPLVLNVESPVYCSKGNALVLQSQEDFPVYALIEGRESQPVPAQPHSPVPDDGAADVSTATSLSWESESQTMTFNVYLGSSPQDLSLVATQDETSYSPPSLESESTYYWRVDETLEGTIANGEVWSFTTT